MFGSNIQEMCIGHRLWLPDHTAAGTYQIVLLKSWSLWRAIIQEDSDHTFPQKLFIVAWRSIFFIIFWQNHSESWKHCISHFFSFFPPAPPLPFSVLYHAVSHIPRSAFPFPSCFKSVNWFSAKWCYNTNLRLAKLKITKDCQYRRHYRVTS